MEINKDNFFTAHLLNNERTIIEVMLREPDMKEGEITVTPMIIEYDENHPDCQALLKLCPLDELHENTWQKKKEEREDFVRQVKKIAESEGLYNQFEDKVDERLYEHIINFLTNDSPEFIDKLFSWKIFLFEQDIVKNYKDEKVKSDIRKSKTPMEALKLYIKIWEENKKSTN